MTKVREPVPLPEPFVLSISCPPVMHHETYRSRACDCGYWQAAVYGVTLPADTHTCITEDGTRRIVHWKRT